ncbi:MAG: DnaA N-terminal domain-containing protein [Pseudomonadota bacterium]
MAAPGADDPVWQAIAAPLRRLVREGAYGSWFGRVGFHGLTDGVLQLSTPSQIAADRIKSQYLDAVLHAAEVAEVFVERVVITLRKDQR